MRNRSSRRSHSLEDETLEKPHHDLEIGLEGLSRKLNRLKEDEIRLADEVD